MILARMNSSRRPASAVDMVAVALLTCSLASADVVVEAGTGGGESGLALKFRIPEHDLYPENIAYDPVTGDYFLGSLSRRRILRVREDGTYRDFVSSPDCGLWSSVGMKVDSRRRALWVCTGRFTLLADYAKAPARTGVVQFDIDNGTPTGEWMLDQESDYHIFNDVALAASGDAYATTTLMGRVYRIPSAGGEMELVLQLPSGSHNNGIAVGPADQYLYLTVDRTIRRLELESGNLEEVAVPEGEALGTDGLYFHQNSLVTVKPRFKRISQLFLDDGVAAVDRVAVLADDHEDFAYPTTGVVVGDRLIFVATSFADVPRNPGSAVQHGDVLIYQVPLSR